MINVIHFINIGCFRSTHRECLIRTWSEGSWAQHHPIAYALYVYMCVWYSAALSVHCTHFTLTMSRGITTVFKFVIFAPWLTYYRRRLLQFQFCLLSHIHVCYRLPFYLLTISHYCCLCWFLLLLEYHSFFIGPKFVWFLCDPMFVAYFSSLHKYTRTHQYYLLQHLMMSLKVS